MSRRLRFRHGSKTAGIILLVIGAVLFVTAFYSPPYAQTYPTTVTTTTTLGCGLVTCSIAISSYSTNLPTGVYYQTGIYVFIVSIVFIVLGCIILVRAKW